MLKQEEEILRKIEMRKKTEDIKTVKQKPEKSKSNQKKNVKEIDDLRVRLKKIQIIENLAAKHFEELISQNFPNINVRKHFMYDINNKPKLVEEDEEYLSIKEMFIWEIKNHFKKNKIIAESKYESQSISEGVRNAKVVSDLNELTEAIIDDVILGYTDVVKLVLSLIPDITPISQARIIFIKKEFEEALYIEEMKNRTYDIRLFKRAKAIYKSNKNKRPITTQAQALFLANEELQVYEVPFRDEDGHDTSFFISMQSAFRKEIKNL